MNSDFFYIGIKTYTALQALLFLSVICYSHQFTAFQSM